MLKYCLTFRLSKSIWYLVEKLNVRYNYYKRVINYQKVRISAHTLLLSCGLLSGPIYELLTSESLWEDVGASYSISLRFSSLGIKDLDLFI